MGFNKIYFHLQLWFCIILLLGLGSCENKIIRPTSSQEFIIPHDFQAQHINNYLFIKKDFQLDGSMNPTVIYQKIKSSFIHNDISDRVALGLANETPNAWLFIELRNSSGIDKELVFDIESHRCDKIRGFKLTEKALLNIGEVERQTPLYDRPLPFVNLALPFSIKKNEKAIILIETSRATGFHEINLRLMDRKEFINSTEWESISMFVQVSFFMPIIIMLLIVGRFFKNEILFNFGLYLIIIINIILASDRYYDRLPFPVFTGLRASNVFPFFIFIGNACFHPLCFAIIKDSIRAKKLYFYVGYILIVINTVMAVLILLIRPQFYYIINPSITHSLGILVTINILWYLYIALLVYWKSGKKLYLVFMILAFSPIVVTYFIDYMHLQGYNLLFRISNTLPKIGAIIIGYIFIQQIINEFKAKQKLEENIQQIKVLVEEIRKKELDRIGRNLHDQIGNTLASALGYLNMKDFNVSKVKTLINQAIVETRFVSHNLVQNDDLPLTEKITSIVSRFNDFSPIHFQFNDFSGGAFNKLPQLEQQNIYTIIQELLTNIIKHSYATNAYVQLFRRNNILSLNVEDDGRGFDITQQFKGIGLQNIRKRAMLMNLHLVIDSTAKGTGIILEIRYESESNNS